MEVLIHLSGGGPREWVAGFDDAPEAFLELATAQVAPGPGPLARFLSPPLTPLVLRLDGEELALRTVTAAARARGRYARFQYRFEAGDARASVSGVIAAPPGAFAALPYDDPPGGIKTCLNRKLACCYLTVRRRGRPPRALSRAHRAAFEILTDARDHGVAPSI